MRSRPLIIQSREEVLPTIKIAAADSPFIIGKVEFKDLRLTVAEPSIDPSTVHQGECYCGKVKLEISRSSPSAAMHGYCHCGDCRIAHSTNVYAGFYWFPFSIPTPIVCVDGAELINYYQRSVGHSIRAFCRECGTRLFNAHPNFLTSFPSIFNTLPFNPEAHYHCRERRTREGGTLSEFNDNLPKFVDFPVEIGGSGEVYVLDNR